LKIEGLKVNEVESTRIRANMRGTPLRPFSLRRAASPVSVNLDRFIVLFSGVAHPSRG
jgi:hypothetical protein